MNDLNWEKPKAEDLGSARDLIKNLGNGKEPGVTDNQYDGLNVQFS